MNALAAAAAEIRAEHALAFGKAHEALTHARRAGELLLDAKAALPHGAWLPWCAANLPFSERTASGYMRLAKNWQALTTKSATVADLPLRNALALLAEPKGERKPLRVWSPPPDVDAMAEELAMLLHRQVARLDEEARILLGRRALRLACSFFDGHERPLLEIPTEALTRELAAREGERPPLSVVPRAATV